MRGIGRLWRWTCYRQDGESVWEAITSMGDDLSRSRLPSMNRVDISDRVEEITERVKPKSERTAFFTLPLSLLARSCHCSSHTVQSHIWINCMPSTCCLDSQIGQLKSERSKTSRQTSLE